MTAPQLIDQAMITAVGHHRAGRLKEAETIYRQVLTIAPNHPEVLHLLGVIASESGQFEEAAAMIRRAIDINPGNPLYYSNLGVVLRDRGQTDEATASFHHALKLKPDYPEALNHLGSALRDAGQLNQAVDTYRRALRLKPDFAVAHSNLGSALRDCGDLDEAIDCFREALRLDPRYASACRNLGNALGDRGNLDEALQCLTKAVSLAPDDAMLHGALLYAQLHHSAFDASAICRESRHWARLRAGRIEPIDPPEIDASTSRRLRVGYVSKFFCDSADIHYILPLLSNHDHSQFEVFVYSDVVRPDELTGRARALADHWHSLVGLSDAQVAWLIRDHRIDIAVIVGHHSSGTRLLAMAQKPAPVLATWLYCASGTTGLDAIDYRISDPFIDPPEWSEACYSERTLRLPKTAWCYDPLVDDLPVNPLPALQNGYITFGSLNRLWKINDAVLALWADVLKAVPASHLCLLAPQGVARQRIRDIARSLQVDPQRIDFVSRHPRRVYLQSYHQIDIVLDTFPYNGHTTSLDALWMGVPVVTLAHRRPVGRVGASLLTNIGLTELVAETPEAFVSNATRLAQDLPALAQLRRQLRQHLQASPLMDARGFAVNMEAAYRHIWQRVTGIVAAEKSD